MNSTNKKFLLPELSSRIKNGLKSPCGGMSLIFSKRGGDGVCWPLDISGQTYWLWCQEQEWCSWISPKLSVENFDEIPQEFMLLLSMWAAPSSGLFVHAKGNIPQRGTITNDWHPVLTLYNEGRSLDCALLDWTLPQIDELCLEWEALPYVSGASSLWSASLIVGWSVMTLTELKKFNIGDGLIIGEVPDICSGFIWMSAFSDRAYLLYQSNEYFKVKEESTLMNSKWVDLGNSAQVHTVMDVPIVISLEAGKLSVPLSSIINLTPGDCLSGEVKINQDMDLLVSGIKIGSGSLIKIDNQWVVRISEINTSLLP